MRLNICERKMALPKNDRKVVERRMRFALTRFAPSIRHISVTLTDEGGPHGPPAKRCQIVIGLLPTGSVVVEATDDLFETAASRAADRAGRTVARQLERRRHNKKYQRRRSDYGRNGDGSTIDNTITTETDLEGLQEGAVK